MCGNALPHSRLHTLRSLGLEVISSTFFLPKSSYTTAAYLDQFFFNQRIKSRKNKPVATRLRKRNAQRIRPSIAHTLSDLPVLKTTPFKSGFAWMLYSQPAWQPLIGLPFITNDCHLLSAHTASHACFVCNFHCCYRLPKSGRFPVSLNDRVKRDG